MWSISKLLCTLIVLSLDFDPVRGQEFHTTNGRVRGKRINILEKSVDVFYGIPFAKPPVGDLRFKHPQVIEPWSPEVKDATVEPPSCTQSSRLFDIIPLDAIDIPPKYFSEDCLYLTVWKPSTAKAGSNLAVMVWIYGGGFTFGSTTVPAYNGQYLAAENDVIVVSINYRVGPLGFSFLGPDTIPGNMGLMDQVEGMKWVKTNIANFGGDPDRITLFGESAGAFSTGFHLLSPLSQDLFNNGILQSGAPIHSVTSMLLHTPNQARNSVKKLSEFNKCSGSSDADIFECLKVADPQVFIDGADELAETGTEFFPVEDDYFLPSHPMNTTKGHEHKKTNILLGVTKDEAILFFYMILNITNTTNAPTGEEFNHEHFQSSLAMFSGLSDTGRLNALKTFYESEQSPPRDYVEIFNHLMSDLMFRCPALQFSSLYTESNDVYLYSLNYRTTKWSYPEWMGVPHGNDIAYVFGLPLNDSLEFTEGDKELSKNMMTYWANFAKSGNPNSPEPVTANWPVFNMEDQTYMALDVGSNLATKHGFRRHQCAFLNDILPMIPKDDNTDKSVTSVPDGHCDGGEKCP